MSKFNHIAKFVGAGFACLVFIQGCTHGSKRELPPAVAVKEPLPEPLEIRLKGTVGVTDKLSHCYESITTTFSNNEIRHKRVESAVFKSQSTVSALTPKGNLQISLMVHDKDGKIDLRDLAFPKVGEVLDLELTSSGQVVKAGAYPKNSIFFLDPIPMPPTAVKKNQSWKSIQTWVSQAGGLTLTAKLSAKWTRDFDCGLESCVLVEIKGTVGVPKPRKNQAQFDHVISGRYLFAPKSGRLVWSEFESKENLSSGVARAEVVSRMRSHLLEPTGYHIPSREAPVCPF